MKAVITGLTCVALVAVLATLSLGNGQEAPQPERVELEIVVNGERVQLGEQPLDLKFENANEFEVRAIELTGDQDVTVVNEGEAKPVVRRIRGVEGAGGETVQTVDVTRTVSIIQGGIQDELARKSLEKIADELEAQAVQLEKAGNAAESESKRNASQAVRGLLGQIGLTIQEGSGAGGHGAGHPPAEAARRAMVNARIVQAGPAAQELRELQKKLELLAAERKKAEESMTGETLEATRRKLNSQMEEVEREISRIRRGKAGFAFAEGGPITIPLPAGAHPAVGMRHVVVMSGPQGGPAADLIAKSEALLRASRAMKEAGRHEEARRLMAESEELKAHAAKVAAEHAAHVNARHAPPGAFAGMAGGIVPAELNSSLKELQEQVQQLRKEIAEVKELLKK